MIQRNLCILVFSRKLILMTTAVACLAHCKNNLPTTSNHTIPVSANNLDAAKRTKEAAEAMDSQATKY
jgi:hypothetical protein